MFSRPRHAVLQHATRSCSSVFRRLVRSQALPIRAPVVLGNCYQRLQVTETISVKSDAVSRNPAPAAAAAAAGETPSTTVLGAEDVSSTKASVASSPLAATAEIEERYPMAMRYLHWAMAAGVLTCFGLVEAGKRVDKPTKKTLMMYHKSVGIVMLGLAVPRVFLRLTRKLPGAVPGPRWEHLAADASHYALYGAVVAMPLSGVTMLYFGNKDIPFFGYTEMHPKPDMEKTELAKGARSFHKLVGPAFEAVAALHVGAVAFHVLFKGQNILKRLHPFVKGNVPK